MSEPQFITVGGKVIPLTEKPGGGRRGAGEKPGRQRSPRMQKAAAKVTKRLAVARERRRSTPAADAPPRAAVKGRLASHADAVAFAKEHVAESVEHLESVPLEVLSDFLNVFSEMMEKHDLPKLSTITGRHHEASTFAAMAIDEGRFFSLRINGEAIQKLKDDGVTLDAWMGAAHERGFMAGSTTRDMAYHEWAHYYYFKKVGYQGRQAIEEIAGEIKDFGGGPSDYARTNGKELFAEAAVAKMRGDRIGDRDVTKALQPHLP